MPADFIKDYRNIQVTRYVTPLREGGSLPAIVEGDDQKLYVLKFRGAGQGVRLLVAEFIGTEIARHLHLNVPELVFAHLDESFGRTEPDEEIQDLLKASTGLNIALQYLSGAITYDAAGRKAEEILASQLVWLDAFLLNVDRTALNTNLLWWNKDLWLIDHGAALYFHYTWDRWRSYITDPFEQVKNHVMLPFATIIDEVDEWYKKLLTPDKIEKIVKSIPDELLDYRGVSDTPDEIRAVYITFLNERLSQSANFVNYAIDARKTVI
ncbi:MAG TPA: aminotransferase class I and II [Saprospiraceae bacterium]|nr:aminotransferase class I and II [Saprospiraceae bacterium]HQW55770.1 aminotransferase class I and II [Saprospiraceae bacterium]